MCVAWGGTGAECNTCFGVFSPGHTDLDLHLSQFLSTSVFDLGHSFQQGWTRRNNNDNKKIKIKKAQPKPPQQRGQRNTVSCMNPTAGCKHVSSWLPVIPAFLIPLKSVIHVSFRVTSVAWNLGSLLQSFFFIFSAQTSMHLKEI